MDSRRPSSRVGQGVFARSSLRVRVVCACVCARVCLSVGVGALLLSAIGVEVLSHFHSEYTIRLARGPEWFV